MDDFTGTVLYVDDALITVTKTGSHHSRSVNGKTKFSVDGKEAQMSELKVGDTVALAGDPVTAITKKTK
jgi:hypothetical protein